MNFPRLKNIIPHRGPMKLVDCIISSDEKGSGLVKATIQKNKPYFDQGKFLCLWLIEIMAQAVAAQAGYESRLNNNRIKTGYLISVDQYSLLEEFPNINIGDELLIDVKLENKLLPFASYSARVDFKGKTISQAVMKFLVDMKGPL